MLVCLSFSHSFSPEKCHVPRQSSYQGNKSKSKMYKRKKYKTMISMNIQVKEHKMIQKYKERLCVFLPLLTRQGHHQERGGDIFNIIAFLLEIKSFAKWPNCPCALNDAVTFRHVVTKLEVKLYLDMPLTCCLGGSGWLGRLFSMSVSLISIPISSVLGPGLTFLS